MTNTIQPDLYLDNLNKGAEVAKAYHLPDWLIATLFALFVVLAITIFFFAIGWRYLKPVLDWVKKYRDDEMDVKKKAVWEKIDKTFDKIEDLKTTIDDNKKKDDLKFNKLENNIEIIKDSQSILEKRMDKHEHEISKHGLKLQDLEEKSELFLDRKSIYNKEEINLAIKIEHKVDDWLFDEFWERLERIGFNNYDASRVQLMFNKLVKEVLIKGDEAKNKGGVSSPIQTLMAETDTSVNKWAIVFFQKFLMAYQRKDINPRREHLEMIVENGRREYKKNFEDTFRKLAKLIVNG